jgi:hypothetical protein
MGSCAHRRTHLLVELILLRKVATLLCTGGAQSIPREKKSKKDKTTWRVLLGSNPAKALVEPSGQEKRIERTVPSFLAALLHMVAEGEGELPTAVQKKKKKTARKTKNKNRKLVFFF